MYTGLHEFLLVLVFYLDSESLIVEKKTMVSLQSVILAQSPNSKLFGVGINFIRIPSEVHVDIASSKAICTLFYSHYNS